LRFFLIFTVKIAHVIIPTMASIVSAKNLVKKFDDFTAVDGISFEIKEGECFGFLGPNGAGKTTTIRMIHCVSPKTSGELKVAGMDAGVDNRAIKSLLGVVPQELNLDEDLTCYENLTLFGDFFGLDRQLTKERVLELLEFVELKGKMNNRISELSTGMKRRLQIARALVNQPKLIIADEPTTGLDPQARHLIWQRLRELKQRGSSMVLTTQYMEEAEQLCDELVIMHQGKIIRQGAPSQLIEEEFGGEMIEVKDSKGRVYRRPATLEDVFLKLTGRQIIE
jgi:lipooligosaccharide transport system ATP-binding protein